MSDTYRLKLHRASKLIKARRYPEARQLLRTIDHPKAKEWLMILDMTHPAQPSLTPKPKTPRKVTRWLWIAFIIIVLLIVCYVSVINPIVTQYNDLIETACADIGGC